MPTEAQPRSEQAAPIRREIPQSVPGVDVQALINDTHSGRVTPEWAVFKATHTPEGSRKVSKYGPDGKVRVIEDFGTWRRLSEHTLGEIPGEGYVKPDLTPDYGSFSPDVAFVGNEQNGAGSTGNTQLSSEFYGKASEMFRSFPNYQIEKTPGAQASRNTTPITWPGHSTPSWARFETPRSVQIEPAKQVQAPVRSKIDWDAPHVPSGPDISWDGYNVKPIQSRPQKAPEVKPAVTSVPTKAPEAKPVAPAPVGPAPVMYDRPAGPSPTIPEWAVWRTPFTSVRSASEASSAGNPTIGEKAWYAFSGRYQAAKDRAADEAAERLKIARSIEAVGARAKNGLKANLIDNDPNFSTGAKKAGRLWNVGARSMALSNKRTAAKIEPFVPSVDVVGTARAAGGFTVDSAGFVWRNGKRVAGATVNAFGKVVVAGAVVGAIGIEGTRRVGGATTEFFSKGYEAAKANAATEEAERAKAAATIFSVPGRAANKIAGVFSAKGVAESAIKPPTQTEGKDYGRQPQGVGQAERTLSVRQTVRGVQGRAQRAADKTIETFASTVHSNFLDNNPDSKIKDPWAAIGRTVLPHGGEGFRNRPTEDYRLPSAKEGILATGDTGEYPEVRAATRVGGGEPNHWTPVFGTPTGEGIDPESDIPLWAKTSWSPFEPTAGGAPDAGAPSPFIPGYDAFSATAPIENGNGHKKDDGKKQRPILYPERDDKGRFNSPVNGLNKAVIAEDEGKTFTLLSNQKNRTSTKAAA